MPEKEEILKRTNTLTAVISPMGTDRAYSENEIWEGSEFGAHYRVIKKKLPPQMLTVCEVTVSGDNLGKEKVIKKFEEAFDKPLIKHAGIISPETKVALWNVKG
jgi:hypothetical protein